MSERSNLISIMNQSEDTGIILSPELIIDLKEEHKYKTKGLRMFIAGQTGSGKSYTVIKTIEEMFSNDVQFIFLDPHGEGHVLSELSDDIIVISQREGIEIPVSIDAIPLYIDIAVNGQSIVLDLSEMFYKSKSQFNEFVEVFCRQFLAAWSNVRRTIFLAMDEAHTFAPQSKTKGSQERVELVGELATGGRKLGIMLCLATQRPAKIDKTPISQANLRLVGNITSDRDYNAFKDYLGKNVSFNDVRELKAGEFFVIDGSTVYKTKINMRITTDAGATPELKPSLSKMQSIKSKDLAQKIQEMIQKAQQDKEADAELKAENDRLKRLTESYKAKLDEKQFQLDTVELIAGKLGGSVTTKTSDPSIASIDLKAEIEKQVSKISKEYEKIIADTNDELSKVKERNKHLTNTTEQLELKLKRFESLEQVLLGIMQSVVVDTPVSTKTETNTITEDMIQKEVARQIASQSPGTGTHIIQAPEKLKLDWEQAKVKEMNSKIDALSPLELKVLSYLIVIGSPVAKTPLGTAMFGYVNAVNTKELENALKVLRNLELIYQGSSKYGARITGFVKKLLEGLSSDIEKYEQQVIYHIQQKASELL